jgi:histidine triad (HIT) family protein
MNEDCVFCKIARGDAPAAKVYEDQTVLAFLDIGPVVKGHTLVIPKAHHNPITHTPPEVLHHLIGVVQRVAGALYTGLQAEGVSVSQANGRPAGQVIPHLHFHVIPRYTADGHHGNWVPRKYEHREEMQDYADRIRKALALSS